MSFKAANTILRAPAKRAIHMSLRVKAKGDSSTIDSYRLPSQTSINEWEFKYDFIPKVAQPKIPPINPEAVKQDIAQTKKQQVEAELFNKELTSSIKVEANDAAVVHGGEPVGAEVEFLHDKGLDPVDASTKATTPQRKKTTNHDNYVQTSINPNINNPDVVNLGHTNSVDHKTAPVQEAKVVDDVEHPQSVESKTAEPETESSGNTAKILGVLGLGGLAGYFWFGKTERKWEAPET